MANIFCCVILHVSNTQLFMTASVSITNSVAGKSHYNSLWSPGIPRALWMRLCWGFNMQHEYAFEVDFSIIPPHWTLFPTMDWSRSTDTIFFQAVTSVEGVMFWIVKSLIPSALQFSVVIWITLCSLIFEIQWPLPKSKCIVQIYPMQHDASFEMYMAIRKEVRVQGKKWFSIFWHSFGQYWN